MAGFLDYLTQAIGSRPAENARPFAEVGVSGTPVIAGRIMRGERNPKLLGAQRWKTSADIMTNFSIVAAGLRYVANLTARPTWKLMPPNDSVEAKDAAAFAESILHGTDTSWSRTVRRMSMYRYHGFGAHEWSAVKRDDGMIGIGSIEPRPPHTIDRWDLDEHMSVVGMWQRPPTTGVDIYLPRQKLVYLVDDAMSDSPEGLGWFRHLVEPSERLKAYLKREGIGFQRDMGGIPIGRAPLAAIEAYAKGKNLSPEATKTLQLELVGQLQEFIQTKAIEPDTGLILDSNPYTVKDGTGGTNISQVMQWGIELLTGTPGGFEDIGNAISRLTYDMAMVMGTERMLVGREGAGSLALAGDTSRNLFLMINATLVDMAETADRDIIGPMWAVNGLDPKLRPTVQVEDASFKDVSEITLALANMGQAGAILAPDDPCIDEVRDLLALSHQPEMTPERMGMLGHGGPGIDDGADSLNPNGKEPEEIKPNEPAGGDVDAS